MLNFFLFLFLIFSSFLNTVYAETNPPSGQNSYSVQTTTTTPKEYVVPYTTKSEAQEKIRESKSCREYLAICERSCKERGNMFKFQCIGQDFQPFEDHFRCTCADDLFVRKEILQSKKILVQKEQQGPSK